MNPQDLVDRLLYAASPAGISEHVALLLSAAGTIESLKGQLDLLTDAATKHKETCRG